jgi:hypothetical protein
LTQLLETAYPARAQGRWTVPSRRLGYDVFDADNHMYETKDALTKFMPSPYKRAIQ